MIPDEGNPHVWMCLEAEGENGNADEEHGDNPDHLQAYFTHMYVKNYSLLYNCRVEVHSFLLSS
jgi:hypothetical protein